MEFRLLGPLEVVADGAPIELGGRKPRTLLAALLVHANELVSAERLIDVLWGDEPPQTAQAALQVHVSHLRKLLGRDRIVTQAPGYRLQVAIDELDLQRFERLLQEARELDPAAARTRLREALALWRGPALADFEREPFAWGEISRLEQLRLEAVESRIDADLAAGHHTRLLPELDAMLAAHPHRERAHAQRMLALYRAGRQADALDAYRAARTMLVAGLGIEPGPELRRLERAILDQDPELDARTVDRSLVARSTSFVGREKELREIRALLGRADVRLLTLTGPPGTGKTRLAVEATTGGGRSRETVFVELAPIVDPALVAPTIAATLGLSETSLQWAAEALVLHLHRRRTLLILDNLEQVLGAAPMLAELLAGTPGTQLLVTSRAPLDLPEEHIYPVPPLQVPGTSRPLQLARLHETEAVRLFVDRAREARADFALSAENAESVAELCLRLDGLPLALELAAARVKLLSPRAILERLGGRLELLKAVPGAGLPERQWTLRAAIEWSYELLGPDQQQLFTSLAVFVGGFTLGAAEVVAEQPGLDMLEGVESLLQKSLLRAEPASGGEPRLGMLETIRAYAVERLAHGGDGEAVRRRHAGFYLVLAEEAELGLWGPQQREWLERLDAERDNIRAALTWAVEASEAEVGLRIGSALWRFWEMRSHEHEARERLRELLALGSGSPSTRAKAQSMIGALSIVLGDLETAQRMLEEGLRVHRRKGDDRMVAYTVGLLGTVALVAGETDTALTLSREAHEVARRAGHTYVESAALSQVGACLAARGELDGAERTLEEAIRLERKLGNARSLGIWLKTLAGVAIMRDDRAQAGRLLSESLAIHRSLDDAWGVSHSLSNLASLALDAGDTETARALLAEALAIAGDTDPQPQLADVLEMSARLAAADGQPALAIRLYARAALLRERVGRQQFDLGWPDPTPHIGDLRSRAGEAVFEAQWERGRAMTLLEAIDQASGER